MKFRILKNGDNTRFRAQKKFKYWPFWLAVEKVYDYEDSHEKMFKTKQEAQEAINKYKRENRIHIIQNTWCVEPIEQQGSNNET